MPLEEQPAGHRAWVCLGPKSLASGKEKERACQKPQVPQEAVKEHGALEVDTALGSPELDVGKKKKHQL